MSAVFSTAVPHRTASPRVRRRLAPVALRVLLLVVCGFSMAAAFTLGDPSQALQADPELARLLRGMATLKGSMVVAAVAVMLWRFGHPIATRATAGYVVGIGLMAGATMLIWQLTLLLPAAAAFHAGLLLSSIVAWRADGDLRTAMS